MQLLYIAVSSRLKSCTKPLDDFKTTSLKCYICFILNCKQPSELVATITEAVAHLHVRLSDLLGHFLDCNKQQIPARDLCQNLCQIQGEEFDGMSVMHHAHGLCISHVKLTDLTH